MLPLEASERPREEISESFKLLLQESVDSDPADFRTAWMEDFSAVEDIFHAVVFLYDSDNVDVIMIGELARRSYSNDIYFSFQNQCSL